MTLPTPTQATTTLPQPPDPATRRESGPGPNNHPRAHPALFRPWRLAAIVAAAFAFGAPGNPLRSIGWSIALATLAGAAIVVTARRPAPVAFGVAGVAFIPWLAVRMSPWLITVNLMVACGLLLGAIGLPASGSLRVSLAHHLARVARAARRLRLGPLHLADEARRASSATGSGDLRRWIAAIAAGVGALAFGLAVLASGDALLASFFDAGGFAGTFTVRLFAAAAGVGGFSLLIGAAPLPGEPDAAPASRATPVLPTLFGIGGLSIAIGAYAASQVSAAVLGAAFVEERTGLTYAEYARGGFFQMVIVAFVSVALIGVARGVVRAAPETTGRVRVGCSALTVGVVATVASAVVKLAVYADTFGLTMLRVYTVVFACWLGLVAVMAYITLLRPAAPWFAPAVLVSVCVGAFAMNIADPERIVVEHNIDRSATTGKLDVDYLSQLSLDAAATVFDRLDEIEAVDDRSRYPFSRVTTPVDAREALRVDWCAKVEGAGTADAMSFNRSRARAIEAAESHCG